MPPLLIGATVGSGASALAAERGGADFLLAISAARLRNMGAPSIVCMLPTNHAQNVVEDFAVIEVLPRVSIPVYLGVSSWTCASNAQSVASDAREKGFSGIVNFPSAMHYSNEMRQVLENAGLGVTREIEILLAAKNAGLQNIFYCGSRDSARAAANAGLDNIVFNFGWNVGGEMGHRQHRSLEECGVIAHDISGIIKSINAHVKFFVEGGPIVSVDDLGYVAKYAKLDGYVGGSTLDTFPLTKSISDRIAGYRYAAQARLDVEKEDDATLAWSRQFGFFGRAKQLNQFLQTFKQFCLAEHCFAVVVEEGSDENPLYAGVQFKRRGSTFIFDMAAHSAQAILQLFGSRLAKRSVQPLLAAESAPVIILRNPHCIPTVVQRRIASAIFQGFVLHQDDRTVLTVTARIIFIRNTKVGSPPLLVAELEELLKDWGVVLPPIRDRANDILALFKRQAFLSGIKSNQLPELSAAAVRVFRGYDWPRNDLDLQRIVGVLLSERFEVEITQVDAELLIGELDNTHNSDFDIPNEKKRVVDALWRNGFHRGRTASELGMSRKTLYNKMIKFGLSQRIG